MHGDSPLTEFKEDKDGNPAELDDLSQFTNLTIMLLAQPIIQMTSKWALTVSGFVRL
ncbi:MAG: hypothetical protein R2788_02900 [Saprospiraceae bacterium]